MGGGEASPAGGAVVPGLMFGGAKVPPSFVMV